MRVCLYVYTHSLMQYKILNCLTYKPLLFWNLCTCRFFVSSTSPQQQRWPMAWTRRRMARLSLSMVSDSRTLGEFAAIDDDNQQRLARMCSSECMRAISLWCCWCLLFVLHSEESPMVFSPAFTLLRGAQGAESAQGESAEIGVCGRCHT